MSNVLHYKGYAGLVEFDAADGTLSGSVLGIRDAIHFEGESVADVERAFRDSVDDYLAWCAERGKAPQKPKSGRILVRVDPEVHRQIETAAAAAGESMNDWIARHLADDAKRAIAGTAPGKPASKPSRRKAG